MIAVNQKVTHHEKAVAFGFIDVHQLIEVCDFVVRNFASMPLVGITIYLEPLAFTVYALKEPTGVCFFTDLPIHTTTRMLNGASLYVGLNYKGFSSALRKYISELYLE